MPTRLIAAALVAVLAIAMTALSTTTVEAKNDAACKVRNENAGQSFDGLRPALAAARSGNTLIVRGTCFGTFIVRTPVRIEGVRKVSKANGFDSGIPRIVSRSHRPALIVLPSVDAFQVDARLRLRGGFGIGQPGADHLIGLQPWPGLHGPRSRARFDRTCSVFTSNGLPGPNEWGGAWITGRCWKRTVITRPWSITADNRLFGHWTGPKGIGTIESGRPALRSKVKPGILIASDVDEMVIEGLIIRDGLRIGAGVRSEASGTSNTRRA